jgi:hypothetical protein
MHGEGCHRRYSHPQVLGPEPRRGSDASGGSIDAKRGTGADPAGGRAAARSAPPTLRVRRRSATPNGAADRRDRRASCTPRLRAGRTVTNSTRSPGDTFMTYRLVGATCDRRSSTRRTPRPRLGLPSGRRTPLALDDLGGRTTFDRHAAKHPSRKDRARHRCPTTERRARTATQPGRSFRARRGAGPEGESGGPLAQAHGQDLPTTPSGTATSSRTRRTTSRPTPASLRPCRG